MKQVHLSAVDLNLLVALDALLEEMSVTRAGARVGLSQSAMSHVLRRLRTSLEDPLFVTVSGRLQATPQAERLRPMVRVALDKARQVFERQLFEPTTYPGPLRIAAFDYQSFQLVPAIMAALRSSAPKASLEITTPTPGIDVALASGAVDIALLGDAGASPGLRRTQLFEDDYVVVMRKGHALAEQPLDASSLVAYDHAFLTITGKGDGLVDSALSKLGLRRRIILRLPHFLAAPLVVAESDLLLTVPRLLALRLAQLAPLAVRELPFPLPGYALHMVWHERVHHDPAHEWFRSCVVDAAPSSNLTSRNSLETGP